MNTERRLSEAMPHKALRGFRLREGWSHADLADRLGIAADLVREWEKGVPVPVPLAIQLADILKTDPLCFLRPRGIDRQELKWLARTFRNTRASLDIEGLNTSKHDLGMIWRLYRFGLSSDDSVMIYKYYMGLRA